MPGHKFSCTSCRGVFWRPRKTPCPACGGELQAVRKRNLPQVACVICGGLFAPRDAREKACSPECRRKNRQQSTAIASLRRYRARQAAGITRAQQTTPAQPWAWLERTFANDSERGGPKRKLLHVLEAQTEAGEWPYYDVLAGVGPSPIDECAFL